MGPHVADELAERAGRAEAPFGRVALADVERDLCKNKTDGVEAAVGARPLPRRDVCELLFVPVLDGVLDVLRERGGRRRAKIARVAAAARERLAVERLEERLHEALGDARRLGHRAPARVDAAVLGELAAALEDELAEERAGHGVVVRGELDDDGPGRRVDRRVEAVVGPRRRHRAAQRREHDAVERLRREHARLPAAAALGEDAEARQNFRIEAQLEGARLPGPVVDAERREVQGQRALFRLAVARGRDGRARVARERLRVAAERRDEPERRGGELARGALADVGVAAARGLGEAPRARARLQGLVRVRHHQRVVARPRGQRVVAQLRQHRRERAAVAEGVGAVRAPRRERRERAARRRRVRAPQPQRVRRRGRERAELEFSHAGRRV